MDFNHLFDELVDFKNATIETIKSINIRIKNILENIEEEREIWSPVNETFDSYFEITEQGIEQNLPINSEEYPPDKKGLADDFLKNEWLIKVLNPINTNTPPKFSNIIKKIIKQAKMSSLRKELDTLLKNLSMLINEYDNKHHLLVENKLKCDMNIILDELQIFLICLSNGNDSSFNKLEHYIQNAIHDLNIQVSSTENLVIEMEDAIVNQTKFQKNIRDKMSRIYDDVEHLSRASRNKEVFLEEFRKRLAINLAPKSNNPYQITLPQEAGSFQDLNNLKPKITPVNIWKEMCKLREKISKYESDLKQNEDQTELLSQKKSELISKQDNMHSKINNLSNYLNKTRTQNLQSMLEVPMAISIDCSQLEMKYPDNLNFEMSLFIRKPHLESLNRLLSGVGGTKLELVQKQARAEFQIEKNQAEVRKMDLELGNLRADMETVERIPMGRELQNILRDPGSFFPRTKMVALEKSAEQERAEIERQIKQVDENAWRIKQKMENLRKGTHQRQKEIEVLKGNLVELHKLGDKK